MEEPNDSQPLLAAYTFRPETAPSPIIESPALFSGFQPKMREGTMSDPFLKQGNTAHSLAVGRQTEEEAVVVSTSSASTFHEETKVIANIGEKLSQVNQPRDRMYLLVIAGAFTGHMFPLQRSSNIGRSSKCDIALRDNDISRKHAEFEVKNNGTVELIDLGSTNGTFVNGVRIEDRIRLHDGDRIQLGLSTILKYSVHDELEEKLQKSLYENAILDGLTQIHNRQFFDEQLLSEFSFARRHGTSLSILLMDLDHFKKVNDTHGHPVGDVVLQRVAEVIQETVRQEDVVARYGGEEFVVLARGILPTQAAILGERIRGSVAMLQVMGARGSIVSPTLSVGVVTMHTQRFASSREMLQEADARLYYAKHQGRNQVVAERIDQQS